MPHILKNENLEIQIDDPLENYNFSRFDWTGKITQVKFQKIPLTVAEAKDVQNPNAIGRGFYNEFGIETALGFEEAEVGDWFHKIGVGLLQKDNAPYLFSKDYEVDPAKFIVSSEANKVLISCKSKTVNGYAYLLNKVIELQESGFTIKYYLENTGSKDIRTTEYNHNFIGINKDLIGSNYILKTPYPLKPGLAGETVNSEQKVTMGPAQISFKGSPKEQFFFSNLTESKMVQGVWKIMHGPTKIGISETCSFETNKVNLWGWEHALSPELFLSIDLLPGKSLEWYRSYSVFKTE